MAANGSVSTNGSMAPNHSWRRSRSTGPTHGAARGAAHALARPRVWFHFRAGPSLVPEQGPVAFARRTKPLCRQAPAAVAIERRTKRVRHQAAPAHRRRQRRPRSRRLDRRHARAGDRVWRRLRLVPFARRTKCGTTHTESLLRLHARCGSVPDGAVPAEQFLDCDFVLAPCVHCAAHVLSCSYAARTSTRAQRRALRESEHADGPAQHHCTRVLHAAGA